MSGEIHWVQCGGFLKLASINPLRTNPMKWLNTLKQLIGFLPTHFLSMFDHSVRLALKGLIILVPI